jgi:2'-5' RNA ligase
MKRNHDHKRIFIALPIGGDLIAQIDSWKKPNADLPVRWLQGKNLHITLMPPWEEEYPDDVIAKLEKMPREIGPISLEFNGTAYGPDAIHPRLIWATGEAPKELNQLKHQVEEAIHRHPDRKRFLQHLTLARFRPDTFKNFPEHHLEKRIHWKTTISSIVVMESKLLPTGADYTVLADIPL